MSVLTLRNVSYAYPKTELQVVQNANFTFENGYTYAIVGPSGSGKSTLLSLMAGLDIPTSGDVLLCGEKSTKDLDLDYYRSHNVSIIFQSFCLIPLLTVIENVCLPMEINGMDKNLAQLTAKEFLSKVGINENLHQRFPGKLSGGEQQRVAIARSVASGAEILLADEPTGNLDVENTNMIMNILNKIAHEEKRCVIIVTHDLEIAEGADIVLKMKGGQLMPGR